MLPILAVQLPRPLAGVNGERLRERDATQAGEIEAESANEIEAESANETGRDATQANEPSHSTVQCSTVPCTDEAEAAQSETKPRKPRCRAQTKP